MPFFPVQTPMVDPKTGLVTAFWTVPFQSFQNLPVFADNTAATAGGLKANDWYRTATGSLMVVFDV
jgi:hypothetical protein